MARERSNERASKAAHVALVCRTMRELSAAVRSLSDYGLDCGNTAALTSEGVEQTLITDEWQCEVCSDTHAAVCARSGAPHRRRLVCIAVHILRLIGARAGELCVRPARLAQRVEGDVKVRAQRRIVMNPQLLLLAFYFVATPSSHNRSTDAATVAAATPSSNETLVAACAQQLLDALHQIAVYGRRLEYEMNARYATTLLRSFCAAWRQYVRHVEREVHNSTPADRRAAAEELYAATRDALLAAARQCAAARAAAAAAATTSDVARDDADLHAFVVLLYQRLTRLATPEQVREVDAALADIAATRTHVRDGDGNDAAATAATTTCGATDTPPPPPHDAGDDKDTSAAPLPTTTAPSPSVEDSLGREWRRPLQPLSLALSDAHTSASDSEAALLLPSPARTAATAAANGDETDAAVLRPTASLPPRWYVDAQGRSRPPPDSAAQAQRERYARLEFRARKAYEAALRSSHTTSSSSDTGDSGSAASGASAASTMSEAQLTLLAEQLNRAQQQHGQRSDDDKSAARVLLQRMLRYVEQRMLEAVPTRLRHRLAQEFRDVVDWSMLLRNNNNSSGSSGSKGDSGGAVVAAEQQQVVVVDAASIASIVQFVTSKVAEYGAPAREAALRERAEHVCRALQHAEPDLGTAVAQAFAFVLHAVRTLADDVAAFSLAMVSSHLREHAVEYVRDFVTTCLPAPRAWTSTLAFVQAFVNDAAVCAWAASAATAAALAATALHHHERRVRGALRRGVVDLLRSAHRTAAARWEELPAECFYFDKPLLFRAANAVQEAVLLLLLEGTVSSLLSRKGLTHAQVAQTLRRLHGEIVRLLAGDVTLARLKSAIVDLLDDMLLCSNERAPPRRAVRAHSDNNNNNNNSSSSSTDVGADAAAPLPASAAALSDVEQRVVAATIDKMTDTSSTLYVTFERKVLQHLTALLLPQPQPSSSTATAAGGSVGAPSPPPPLGLVTETIQQHARELDKALAFNWEVYAPFYRELIPALVIE